MSADRRCRGNAIAAIFWRGVEKQTRELPSSTAAALFVLRLLAMALYKYGLSLGERPNAHTQ